eukprot:scaffold22692_cov198-Cylindrotheca_fusiformis.AAC.3
MMMMMMMMAAAGVVTMRKDDDEDDDTAESSDTAAATTAAAKRNPDDTKRSVRVETTTTTTTTTMMTIIIIRNEKRVVEERVPIATKNGIGGEIEVEVSAATATATAAVVAMKKTVGTTIDTRGVDGRRTGTVIIMINDKDDLVMTVMTATQGNGDEIPTKTEWTTMTTGDIANLPPNIADGDHHQEEDLILATAIINIILPDQMTAVAKGKDMD